MCVYFSAVACMRIASFLIELSRETLARIYTAHNLQFVVSMINDVGASHVRTVKLKF